MSGHEVWVKLYYEDEALTPGGLSRDEPTNAAELVEEIDRAMNASHFGGNIVLELTGNCPQHLVALELKRARQEKILLEMQSEAKLEAARKKIETLERMRFDIGPALKEERLFQGLCVFSGKPPTLICGGYFSDHPACESCVASVMRRPEGSDFLGRLNQACLATCHGVLEGLTTDDHLGVAVKRYRYKSRTLQGDSFEHAFEWAREEKKRKAFEMDCSSGCSEGSDCPCYRSGFYNASDDIDG